MAVEQGTLFDGDGEEQGKKRRGRPPKTAGFEQILSQDWQNGLTIKQVAAKHGFHPNSVRIALVRIGAPTNRRLGSQERAEIARDYQEGKSSSFLAVKYGVFPGTVLNIVRLAGVTVRPTANAGLPEDMRRCPQCNEVKSRAEGFYQVKPTKAGKPQAQSICKTCVKAQKKQPKWKEYGRLRNRAIRLETIAVYGGKCACCGESHWEFLTIDHVHGKGNAHRKELKKKGVDFFIWLKRQGWPKEDYRLLCYSCNLAIGFYGSCPHAGPQDEGNLTLRQKKYRQLRAEVLQAYGGKCECCGESALRFLAIDHIQGGGDKDRKRFSSHVAWYAWLKREGWPQGTLRLLCHNCNESRGITGYCPCGSKAER